MSEYTAIVKQDGGWWISWIEEVAGVNCQEASRDALLETLRITLEEALEANRADTRSAASEHVEESASPYDAARAGRSAHTVVNLIERGAATSTDRWVVGPHFLRHSEIRDELVRKICRDLGKAGNDGSKAPRCFAVTILFSKLTSAAHVCA